MQFYLEAGGLWAASLGVEDRPPGGLGMTLTGTLRITWALYSLPPVPVPFLFLLQFLPPVPFHLMTHSIL